MLTLCGAMSAPQMGCISTGQRTIEAERPWAMTRIDHFELSEGQAVVVGGRLYDANKYKRERITVTPRQWFEANGTNCTEKWTLIEAGKDSATFDVRGRYYSCTDIFAIFMGIPSTVSHWSVVVKPREGEDDADPNPRWFR
jgi:hypothetical protein